MKVAELKAILSTMSEDAEIETIEQLLPPAGKIYVYRCTLCGKLMEADGDVGETPCRCLNCGKVSVWDSWKENK